MAQDFSYRYPIIDGQGNWGSTDDPKSFAAMRYTESRLRPTPTCCCRSWSRARSSGCRTSTAPCASPSLLPARLPNLLLNGATGIAVGMSTDMPPHNLREVAAGLRPAARRSGDLGRGSCRRSSRARISRPAAEIVSPRDGDRRDLRHRHRDLRVRATYRSRTTSIIIDSLPYQVSGAKVLEQIATQMRAKKLPMVEDLRDESDDEEPTRLVIVVRSNRVDVEALMRHLFATTDLEKTLRVNLNVIGTDGRPPCATCASCCRTGWSSASTRSSRRLQLPAGARQRAPAHPRRPADRLPQHRRGHPHHPQGGRAEARADEEVPAHRHPGRGDSQPAAAPPGPARGDEDPRRAEGTRRRARPAREAPAQPGEAAHAGARRDRAAGRGVRRRAAHRAGRARRRPRPWPRRNW